MDYVIGGNVMLDSVRFADGATSPRESIGGPAVFAYSGVKIWTDSVMQTSNVGADYHELFDPWMEKNDVTRDGFKVKTSRCNHSYLVYNEDGTYGSEHEDFIVAGQHLEQMGYMKTSPEEISEWTKGNNVKGVYMAQNVDRVWWDKLRAIKKRDGFKMMWEIEGPSSYKKHMDNVLYAMESVDIFSINIQEARNLFEVETEEECIDELQKMPVDMTLFRVGAKGAHMVTSRESYYLPPAPSKPITDPTGCGNTSTGGALYAYAEGHNALMVGIIANIAAAQNIRQYGVIQDFKAIREESFAQAEELYEHYKKEYGL